MYELKEELNIENHNYIMSIGSYYKYLLRKKFYEYTDKENNPSKFYNGKRQWEIFRDEILQNIEKTTWEKTEDTAIDIIKKNIVKGSFYDFKKAVENKLVKEKDYEELIKDVIAYRKNREMKKLRYEAEAKFWMRINKRDKVA